METDLFDAHSVHCLLRHKATGQAMGTVRVVTPYEKHHMLPLEYHCAEFIDKGKINPADFL